MRYGNAELSNVRDLIPAEGGHSLSRLPEDVRACLSVMGQSNALAGAGVEVRFVMQGEPVSVTLQWQGPGVGMAEVYFGAFQHSLHVITDRPTTVTVMPDARLPLLAQVSEAESLPFDPHVVRVLLPYDYPTLLLGIDGAHQPPTASQVPTRRLLTYGSSITQGSSAISPSGTYAFRTAHACGCDLLNVGLAGSAYMEPALADWIAGCGEWDMAVLEMGINVLYTDWTDTQFADAVHGFVERIACANPEKWIFCVDVFSLHRDWPGEPRADAFRSIVREAVRSLALPRLVHIDGRALLTSGVGLSFDTVHPSAQGMEEIAARLSARILETMV